MARPIKLPAPQAAVERSRAATTVKPSARWYDLKAADSSTEAQLFIYGEIGSYWDSVPVAELVRALTEIRAPAIRVRINSPGGDVYGGISLYNALVQHPARIITQVDGLAASISSLIFMAGAERLMGAGTRLMIHDPWCVGIGNAEDLRTLAGWLDGIGQDMAEIYAEASGQTVDEAKEVMAAETWLSADEAIASGYADSAVTTDDAPAQMRARFDLSLFAHVPPDLAARQDDRRTTGPAVATVRDVEKILRDGGCSHAQAKAIAAAGFKAATPEPRDEDGEMALLYTALQQRGNALASLTRQP